MEKGEVWLIEAYRDPRDQQWTTSLCQRSKPVEQAADDLRVLRLWANRQTLPASFNGEVFDRTQNRRVAGAGETIMRLENLSRTEPDPSLLQVPSDYEIRDQGSFAIP